MCQFIMQSLRRGSGSRVGGTSWDDREWYEETKAKYLSKPGGYRRWDDIVTARRHAAYPGNHRLFTIVHWITSSIIILSGLSTSGLALTALITGKPEWILLDLILPG